MYLKLTVNAAKYLFCYCIRINIYSQVTLYKSTLCQGATAIYMYMFV
jgi:hypothetical protein